MTIETLVRPEYTTLRPQHHLRYADRQEFRAAVEGALKTGCRRVILDLQQVNFIDSAALSILAMTAHLLKQEQRSFGLLRPTETIMKLLTISGVHNIIPIYHSELEITSADAA
jgi:anti-anti-sigma factor